VPSTPEEKMSPLGQDKPFPKNTVFVLFGTKYNTDFISCEVTVLFSEDVSSRCGKASLKYTHYSLIVK